MNKAAQAVPGLAPEAREELLKEVEEMLQNYGVFLSKKEKRFLEPHAHHLWVPWSYFSSRQLERILIEKPLDLRKLLDVAGLFRERFMELQGESRISGKLRESKESSELFTLIDLQTQKVLECDSQENLLILKRRLGDWYHLMCRAHFYETGSEDITQWLFKALCRMKELEIPPMRSGMEYEALARTSEAFRKEIFYPWMMSIHQHDA